MRFAPIGIGAAIAVTVGHSGLGVLGNLAKLVATLYGALVVFMLVVLLPVALLCRIPIRRFWHWVKEPWLIAFSTASSEAALPLALENMEKFGVPKRIVVVRAADRLLVQPGRLDAVPGGGLDLRGAGGGRRADIGNQLLMMLTLMLTSKGVAAVPRASLVILSGTLATFGLPLEGVAVILGVDALMDMARTSVNLLGNCLASAVMARMGGRAAERRCSRCRHRPSAVAEVEAETRAPAVDRRPARRYLMPRRGPSPIRLLPFPAPGRHNRSPTGTGSFMLAVPRSSSSPPRRSARYPRQSATSATT